MVHIRSSPLVMKLFHLISGTGPVERKKIFTKTTKICKCRKDTKKKNDKKLLDIKHTKIINQVYPKRQFKHSIYIKLFTKKLVCLQLAYRTKYFITSFHLFSEIVIQFFKKGLFIVIFLWSTIWLCIEGNLKTDPRVKEKIA